MRPLPRWALLLLCAAYVLAGFFGRDPWRGDDMQAFGFMRAMALGQTDWSAPLLAGQPPETGGLLPLWLGAGAMRLLGHGLPLEIASRIPFIALLALTLFAAWHAVYHLARSPLAQPVAFAFGGEADPHGYARAIADGGLLALIASLGLAQFSHEATSNLTQLASTTLLLYAAAALRRHRALPGVAAAAGLLGLTLSGAPTLAVLLGTGSAVLALTGDGRDGPWRTRLRSAALLLAFTALAAAWATWHGLWRWRIALPGSAQEWLAIPRLLLWFIWPTWLLTLWTLWRWRHLIAARAHHLLLPLWFGGVALAVTCLVAPSDRALLQGLPAFAALAAFALPTLTRSVSAIIDWFTLLFFSVAAITVWVIWLAVQTGIPATPAANVARLAPGFQSHFALLPFAAALAGTTAWCALVRWRTARHRAAIWKSLVLPAGGAALGWVLLMTLWLPLLDYGRSYAPQVALLRQAITEANAGAPPRANDCVAGYGLDQPLVAALIYQGGLDVAAPAQAHRCHWAIVDPDADAQMFEALPPDDWQQVAIVTRPTDRRDQLTVLRRAGR